MDLMDKEKLIRMFDDIFTTCTTVSEEVLARYAELEMTGQELDEQLPEVGVHLDECSDCAGRYAELLALLRAEARGEVPPMAPIRPFDLQFIPTPGPEKEKRPLQPVSIPWRLDELVGRLIIEFSAELLRALQSPAYKPAYARARLKSEKSSRTLCKLSLKEAVKDLEVTITAEETRDDPTRCTVIVEVNIPSRGGWPHLADTEVVLKRDKRELETQRTDAFGEAVFEGIATDDLAHLVFEITPCP